MPRVWPFAQNWRTPFKVTYEAKTDINLSRSNREQRIADRLTPRKSYEFESLVYDGSRQRLERILAKSMASELVMAEASRTIEAPAGIGLGSSTFNVAEAPGWLVADSYLVLNDGDTWAYAVVDSVVGTTVTLTGPADHAWPATSMIYHGALGYLKAPKASELTDAMWSVSGSFDCEPGLVPDETTGAAGETFNGREVFLWRPNWGREVSSDFEYPRDIIDYDRGIIANFNPVDFLTRTRKGTWLAKTRAEAEALREFFHRMLGRQDEFYVPTGSADLTPLSVAAGNLTVAGSRVYEDYAGDSVYAAVCVFLNDGTRVYRQVSGITLVGGNSVVAITPVWAISLGDIRYVSWLPVCRFASDSMSFEWLTDVVAQVELSFMSLEDLDGE